METAKELCSSWWISHDFHVNRLRFNKRHFDEIDGDRRLNITEENLRIQIVNQSLIL